MGSKTRLGPKGPHSAGCPAGEVNVTYPFHPLCGETVLVLSEQIHNGVRHFWLQNQNGSSYLMPAWMDTPEAASIEIVASPCLPVTRLLELHAFVISVLRSSTGQSAPVIGDANDKSSPIRRNIISMRITGDSSMGRVLRR